MVVGCGISKSVQYEHKPSESFYKNFEMKDEKIKNFTEDGILITIYFQEVRYDIYNIGFGFFTKEKSKKIYIKRIGFFGNNNKEYFKVENNFPINNELKVKGVFKDIYDNEIVYKNVERADIERFFGEGDKMYVTIDYVIDNNMKRIVFEVEKSIEKRVITPT